MGWVGCVVSEGLECIVEEGYLGWGGPQLRNVNAGSRLNIFVRQQTPAKGGLSYLLVNTGTLLGATGSLRFVSPKIVLTRISNVVLDRRRYWIERPESSTAAATFCLEPPTTIPSLHETNSTHEHMYKTRKQIRSPGALLIVSCFIVRSTEYGVFLRFLLDMPASVSHPSSQYEVSFLHSSCGIFRGKLSVCFLNQRFLVAGRICSGLGWG